MFWRYKIGDRKHMGDSSQSNLCCNCNGCKTPKVVITNSDRSMRIFIQEWEVMVNECVNNVEWTSAYIRGQLFVSIRTTFRCESLHAKLGRVVEGWYEILEFITNFQWYVEFLRDNENELEFCSSYRTCDRNSNPGSWRSLVQSTLLEKFKYRWPEKKWNVTYISSLDTFHYTCLHMESFGLPYIHILAVLVCLDIGCLPRSLVLERWSKIAKVHTCMDRNIHQGGDMETHYTTKKVKMVVFWKITAVITAIITKKGASKNRRYSERHSGYYDGFLRLKWQFHQIKRQFVVV
ncbi:hypothetical protein Ahy_A05g025573 [Arachis hypogaea]|uniref:Protein FAR1-RELATED SEQUENCE n=1 Tax=Arachis hypogaea TaxID=3818 RepID=A0A445D920_ARAHY|nr:hypothetical protein Ahy_A05g025573 [Arachis hypogaea]